MRTPNTPSGGITRPKRVRPARQLLRDPARKPTGDLSARPGEQARRGAPSGRQQPVSETA